MVLRNQLASRADFGQQAQTDVCQSWVSGSTSTCPPFSLVPMGHRRAGQRWLQSPLRYFLPSLPPTQVVTRGAGVGGPGLLFVLCTPSQRLRDAEDIPVRLATPSVREIHGGGLMRARGRIRLSLWSLCSLAQARLLRFSPTSLPVCVRYFPPPLFLRDASRCSLRFLPSLPPTQRILLIFYL